MRRRVAARLGGLHAGGRLLLCFIAAGALYALTYRLDAALRLTLAWDAGVALFLGLTLAAIGGTSPDEVRRRAGQLDDSAAAILGIIVAAAAASLVALAFVLPRPGASAADAGLRAALAGIAVIGSWLVAHTAFAMHYAHAYYGDAGPSGKVRGGLAFPGNDKPDYWDFLYYALVVGMTCQVSDVQVTARQMRRLTLLHGVIAFFFNTGVLAVAVNIFAALL